MLSVAFAPDFPRIVYGNLFRKEGPMQVTGRAMSRARRLRAPYYPCIVWRVCKLFVLFLSTAGTHGVMSKNIHRLYIAALVFLYAAGVAVTLITGMPYFGTPEKTRSNMKADLDARKSDLQVQLQMLEQGLGGTDKSADQLRREIKDIERKAAYYSDWNPAGTIGHGLGIVGSLMMIAGVAMYSSRKRVKAMRQWGKLKYWLEFHIFLCLLGPTFVLFHTTFKFGGLVSVSFWSMVAVVLSGVIGRYIYTQIPRGLAGNELTIDEMQKENEEYEKILRTVYSADDRTIELINHISRIPEMGAKELEGLGAIASLVKDDLARSRRIAAVRAHLREMKLPAHQIHTVIGVAKKKSLLVRKIAFLGAARQMFHYWHVIHQPFSIVMFVILVIHVVVTVSLGYRWIF